MRPILFAGLVLASCGNSPTMTLDQALQQTQQALAHARQTAANTPIGYYPCKLTARFAVGGLLEVAGPPPVPMLAGVKLGVAAHSDSSVEVEMESSECGAKVAPGTAPLMTKAPR